MIKNHVQMDVAYQCGECDFAAVRREELKSHVKTVHRDGDYQCDETKTEVIVIIIVSRF